MTTIDTEILPRGAEDEATRLRRPWVVILYNDDWHDMDEVTLQIQRATGYSVERAEQVMWEAHTRGRAIAYQGTHEECERVAAILREIRLQVETDSA